MGRPALAIGGVALIVAGAAVALGWDWWPLSHERAETREEVTERISSVHVDNGSGDVHIRVEDTTTTSVHQAFRYHGDQPDRAFTVARGQLVLAGCGDDCSVDYEVVVPRGATVDGEVRSGDFVVSGAASVDLRAASGDIAVRDVTGAVTTSTKSGDIEVFLAVPQDVRAETSSGDVRIHVPADRYRVTGETRSGARRVDVVEDPAAEHVLDVSTSSGDVAVVGA